MAEGRVLVVCGFLKILHIVLPVFLKYLQFFKEILLIYFWREGKGE